MYRILLSSFLLMISFLSCAQEKAPPKTSENLDSISRMIKETYDTPGLAIGIVLDNQLYFSKGLGVQDLESKSPLTPSSLFHMASVSKPFVATAIMQLVEAGKMNLEDRLIDHLPYFAMKDERFRDITIKQILNHTSGIPDVRDYEWDKPQYDDGAAERYAKSFKEVLLDFGPGEKYSYSNASFNILADVIAKVSGLTFEDYMTKHIFEPAGMSNSTFYKPDVPKELATSPHSMGNNLQMDVLEVYPYNRIHAPSSTLHSNVEDMAKWALLYMNKGTVNGKRIFSEQSYKQLTSSTLKLNESRDICLSWFTQLVDGEQFYYHSGGDDGYRSFFGFFPERKAAVILMGNNDRFQSMTAASYLINNILIHKPKPWKKLIHMELKNLILTEGIDSCKAFYYRAQQEMADQYEFGGDYINDLGYWLLERKKYNKALDVFLFNVELFPKDANLYDSVGDAYVAMEDKQKAIDWYRKALVLNPEQDFTIEKLKKLEE